VRNLSRYINETGACITNNKFNKQNDASFIREEGKKRTHIILYRIQYPRRDQSDKNQTAYCVVDGVGIVFKQKKLHHVAWSLLCVWVGINFELEKNVYPNPILAAQVTRTPNMCWTHSTGGGSRNLTERMSFWVVTMAVGLVVVAVVAGVVGVVDAKK